MVSLLADKGKGKAQTPVNVHFLGTCSGGGPIVSRNCSSLAVDLGNDIWLFDVADGTLGRLQQSSLKMSNISRIFLSHMHGDHVLGLVAVLKQIMSGVGTSDAELEALAKKGVEKVPNINIYGPPGVRELIRTCLRLCSINLSGAYAVHELLAAGAEASVSCKSEELPVNEAVGGDVRCDSDGVWRSILQEGNGKHGRGWSVTAGPLQHRVACVGYILTEPTPTLPLDTQTLIPLLTSHKDALAQMDPPIRHPLAILSRLTSLPPTPFTLPDGTVLQPPAPSGIAPRKLVIFGDCSGGTPNAAFEALCADPSLLVHECTNAAVPAALQKGEKGRQVRVRGLEHSMVKKIEIQKGERLGDESVSSDAGCNGVEEEEEAKREETRKKAKSRGHSTPREVGEFASKIRPRRLVVNHFSAMFPAPRYPTSSPYPSLLSPISPFLNPTPFPLSHSPDPEIPPHPLTERELHIRVILQSLVEQISEEWARALVRDGPDARGEVGRAVAARDFMMMRIPAHELSDDESEVMDARKEEAAEVLRSWAREGGVWVSEEGGKGKRWVGVGPSPESLD